VALKKRKEKKKLFTDSSEPARRLWGSCRGGSHGGKKKAVPERGLLEPWTGEIRYPGESCGKWTAAKRERKKERGGWIKGRGGGGTRLAR